MVAAKKAEAIPVRRSLPATLVQEILGEQVCKQNNQKGDQRNNHGADFSVFFHILVVSVFTSHGNTAVTKSLTGLHGSVLCFQHGAVIPLGKCQKTCHKQGQDCVIVKGNRLNKDIHTGYIGDGRVVKLCLNQ